MENGVESINQSEPLIHSQNRVAQQKRNASPEDFEARLQELYDRLEDLNADSTLVSFDGRPHVFDAALDLRVKVEAVRWMLRVAKHLAEPARQPVLATIGNSLDQLERAFEASIHDELAETSTHI
ncbi:MAG: hypothetical protein ABSG27_03145 [Candidatus Acidiferrales bacterium]|jgi:hypothetical protein